MTSKTTKTIFFSVILLAVSISLVFGTSYAMEGKEQQTELVPEPNENAKINNSIDVQEFSAAEIDLYKNIAINDPNVKLLLGENYEYENILYRLDSKITVFELTFDTGDSRVNVVFDDGKIVDVVKYEKSEPWTQNGFVVKYYDSTTDLKGVGHKFETPSSYSSSSSTQNILLTNGVKVGSDTSKICVSSQSPTHYWGQAGVAFDSNGIRAGWTDTNANCNPTYFTSLSISAGDEIITRVYLDSTVANKWWMTADNLDDGYNAYGFTRTITGSTELLKGDPNTGVFWESHFTPNQGWDTDFGSDVVSDWASYKHTSNNNWYLWGSETQDTSVCKPSANPTSVVSGAFDTGNRDVTWDVSDIEDDCGRG